MDMAEEILAAKNREEVLAQAQTDLLANHRFQISSHLPSDGHCQYRGIITELERLKHPKSRLNVYELREETASYVEKTEEIHPFLDTDLPTFLARIRGTEWGDHITLQAMSELLEITICVLSTDMFGLIRIHRQNQIGDAEVYLFNWDNRHYEVMRPIAGNGDSAVSSGGPSLLSSRVLQLWDDRFYYAGTLESGIVIFDGGDTIAASEQTSALDRVQTGMLVHADYTRKSRFIAKITNCSGYETTSSVDVRFLDPPVRGKKKSVKWENISLTADQVTCLAAK